MIVGSKGVLPLLTDALAEIDSIVSLLAGT